MGIWAAGITKGSLKRRNSPSSKVMPFTSICSPADVAAWASRPDWKVRPAIMQVTQTSWSRSHSGHMGYGSSGDGQASQNPVVGLPQATQGCRRDLSGSGKGRAAHAKAAHASRSHNRRPRGKLWGSPPGLALCQSKERRSRALQSAATTDGMASKRWHDARKHSHCREIETLTPCEIFWTQRTFDTTILYPLVKTQLVATRKSHLPFKNKNAFQLLQPSFCHNSCSYATGNLCDWFQIVMPIFVPEIKPR